MTPWCITIAFDCPLGYEPEGFCQDYNVTAKTREAAIVKVLDRLAPEIGNHSVTIECNAGWSHLQSALALE